MTKRVRPLIAVVLVIVAPVAYCLTTECHRWQAYGIPQIDLSAPGASPVSLMKNSYPTRRP
jgi:hypothetical protein